jgi:hypothetical protein
MNTAVVAGPSAPPTRGNQNCDCCQEKQAGLQPGGIAVIFKPIACRHRSTRERHVTIMIPLGIAKIIGEIPSRRWPLKLLQIGRERSCPLYFLSKQPI